MASKISKRALETIQQEEISPKPRWHFMAQGGLFWFIFVLSVLVGARMFGAMLFVLSSVDFAFFLQTPTKLNIFFFSLFPFQWFSAFLLFLLFASFGLHKTEKGYRISLKKLVVVNIIATIFLGGALFAIGDGERFEKNAQKVPFYSGVDEKRRDVWGRPESGMLVGEIFQITDTSIVLIDPKRNEWNVEFNGEFGFIEGDSIRVTGDLVRPGEFKADAVYQWDPREKPRPKKNKKEPIKRFLKKSERKIDELRMN